MKQTGRFTITILMIALIIFYGTSISFAESNENEERVIGPTLLGKVEVKKDVTFEIKNLINMKSGNNQTVSFLLTINNNSNSQINFLDYWIDLYSKNGSKFNMQLENNSSNIVAAKSSGDYIFYSKIGWDVKLSDLIIKVIKWNFSSLNYEEVLGQITVPERYNSITPSNTGRTIHINEMKTTIQIKRTTIGKSSQYYRPEVQLSIKNDGSNTVELPDYEFYIQTSENLLYPLSLELKGTVLDPLTDKEYKTSTSIPISIKEDNWKIVMTYTINEGKDKIPVALFELPKQSNELLDQLNKYYAFSTADGIYYAKIEAVNRLPIEDNDLIVSNLTIKNNGSETIPIPKLSALYVFNDKIEVTSTVTMNDKIIGITPGESIEIQVVGKVPYTFDINQIQLFLQDKDSESNIKTNLLQFTHSGDFAPIKTLSSKQGYKITDVGYRSEVKVRNILTYSGTSADILGAQITVTNEEKRLAETQQLTGYFEKQDGTIYPASIQNIEEKINPNGTAMIYASAIVPKNTDKSDMKLIIGKAIVVDSKLPDGSESSSLAGYVSPYAFDLQNEMKPQDNLQSIDLYPFKLSINRIKTQLFFDSATVHLIFDYTLDQDLLGKANLKDHKIIFEIKDTKQRSIYFKGLDFGTSPETNDTDSLSVGKHTIEITQKVDESFALSIQTLRDFTLNVYYEFQPGYKKLIANQQFPWFVDRTISE